MVWAGKEGKPRKGGKPKKEASYYKDTVLLPQTAFNLRANSVVREPEIQKLWEEMDVYNSLLKDSKGDPFTLHDGPPYANGDLHIGHALNKILKDFINRCVECQLTVLSPEKGSLVNGSGVDRALVCVIVWHVRRFQMLQGRRVRYRPGWDCHGLPIELKVLQSMSDEARAKLTPLKLRYKARDFAVKTMKSQRDQFRRYGIWGDWEDPYLTLLPEYEAKQLEVCRLKCHLAHPLTFSCTQTLTKHHNPHKSPEIS
jgi:isoleucyl-tRNA synthetase